jgi:hypothetical protein
VVPSGQARAVGASWTWRLARRVACAGFGGPWTATGYSASRPFGSTSNLRRRFCGRAQVLAGRVPAGTGNSRRPAPLIAHRNCRGAELLTASSKSSALPCRRPAGDGDEVRPRLPVTFVVRASALDPEVTNTVGSANVGGRAIFDRGSP